MRILMPISEDIILESHLRSEVIKSTIVGSFLIHDSGSGSFAVTSTWSASSQSRPSNTFTNMSIKATIAPLWNLDDAWMRSSCIWTLVMFPPVKEFGGCFSSQCMRSPQILSNSRFICQISNRSFGMKIMLQMYRPSLRSRETRTPP